MLIKNQRTQIPAGILTHPLVTSSIWKLAIACAVACAALGQSVTTLNLGTQSRNPDFSSQAFTRPISVGASLPSTCLAGQLFFNSSAASGSNLNACTATNVWTAIGNQTALVLPLSVANGGSGTATPSLIAGTNVTVTGTWPNQTVSATGTGGTTGNATAIQGTAVSSAAPVNNQALIFNATSSAYAPASLYTLQAGLGTTATGSGSLQVNISMGVRAVTATTDALLNSDCGGLVTYNNPSPVTVGLSQPSLGGNFLTGCPLMIRNYGAGLVAITPSNSTVGGVTSQTVAQGKGCQLISDGTNWQLGMCN